MGQSESNSILAAICKKQGRGILIWLEGWDELDESFAQGSILIHLLHGKVLPLADIAITTRPSSTRSLKRFTFTHKF